MSGIFVAEQVTALERCGNEVDVLFLDGINDGMRAYAAGFGRVRRALEGRRYDIVHAHYVFSGLVALGGGLAARPSRRPPVVLTHHGIETQMGWTAPLCRLSSRFVARTIATSERVRDALGRPDAAVIPCGVDTDLFAPMPRAEARRLLSLAPDAPLVLFAGMRRPEKRFDLIQAAFEQARSNGRPDARLVVAEHEAHERMPLFMNACDALVLASEAEGSPMVIKEAMACNLPIVSVDVGDVKQVCAGMDGCFVVERTVEELARGIDAALTFGGRTAGRRAVERLSLSATTAELLRVYGSVARRSAKRGTGAGAQERSGPL
jgi:glycosyltransferase involved in cell wall biosynthesis